MKIIEIPHEAVLVCLTNKQDMKGSLHLGSGQGMVPDGGCNDPSSF
jgi:hypothetical protein